VTDPFETLARLQLTDEEMPSLRLTGFDMYALTVWQVQAVAALVAPPGQKVEAVRIVRNLMTSRAARYQPPQSEALEPPRAP
jgi:hypothetical protein